MTVYWDISENIPTKAFCSPMCCCLYSVKVVHIRLVVETGLGGD